MYRIRPVRKSDLDALLMFAKRTALGLISLPKRRSLLAEKIQHAIDSFKIKQRKPHNEFYLFVLEDFETGKIAGTCGIYSKIGLPVPLYGYRVDTIPEEKQQPLPLIPDIRLLTPIILTGPSELCALYIAPEHRKEGLGKLISFSRFLFIAAHPRRFEKTLMARMRGIIHKRKETAPFWEDLGRIFIPMNLRRIMAIREKEEPVLPTFLMSNSILIPLLSHEAQKSIGQTHKTTVPALKMLQGQGFSLTPIVDFFDAGPILEAKTNQIAIIKNSKKAIVKEITNQKLNSTPRLLANTSIDFRSCFGSIKIGKDGRVTLPKEVALALELEPGQEIRYV